MRPVTVYTTVPKGPATWKDEEPDRASWPNCVGFYLALKNGVYHMSHGPCGVTPEDMKNAVVERIESYAGTELSWTETLGLVYAVLAHSDESFKGDGIRIEDRQGDFYVTMQDRRV